MKNWLKGIKESESVELKSSLSQVNEIIEAVSAFANTKGGKIVVGVSNSGRILGVETGKDTIERLTNHIRQEVDPKIHPHIFTAQVENNSVIIIEVKPAPDKLVLAAGRPYKRMGKSTVKMSKDEYEGAILEKHKDNLQFDKQVCKGAKLKDIDGKKVKEFLKEAKSKRGLDLDENTPLKESLMRLKLIRDGSLSNAALLLFGKDTQEFFEQSEVKCVRFRGMDVTGEMVDLKTVGGNIIDQLVEVEKFVFDHISLKSWIEPGKIKRQEKWEYPPKAIREALANAVAHRDYTSRKDLADLVSKKVIVRKGVKRGVYYELF